MACTPDFVQYVADQCAGAGEIKARKMFDDYALYADGKLFALLCDDALYVKPTEAGRALLPSVDLRPPYPGAKPHFLIENVDDRAFLAALVRATCSALPG